ncbi:S9 family peptidase [Actinomadura madurae]|uniref:S9 family peptidase n=1 Tax=Actinomadura madurae TaxID=1993 RepID=UPI0020264510|nr:prolyl oligopeptidase family serine peptidase [Actinomadura madurae]MCP9950150.1 prolyl oligopeptidase family serine peptidase [Actinomadura madurae]MCP9979395.1 prolyl oligopeptidase family serine peptidase [Actinomadura madurae]MCQ0009085.1 prolyl oligopeptidase family serine peptidase [Actinomadura madurae]URN06411.1 prolyl oligopeptidase family serine peptidase [Actinomadura madurae]
MSISYPRQSARTRRFSLGVPRAFQIAPDESRVAFLRTRAGDDPVTCLWTLDTATGEERCVADPAALDVPGEENLPAEERARRERAREQAGGIVGYATDQAMRQAVFTLGGRLHVADLDTGLVRELPARPPVFDARPDPAGRRVAYVSGRTLRLIEMDGTGDRALVQPESDQVSYGLAEFVAAEEMDRMRGHWWSPDGGTLLVARVDETPVQRWHIADPANPDRPPSEIAYPAAGTPNALVSLVLLKVDGGRVAVAWDRGEFPYVVTASWDRHGLLVVVQPRDQRSQRVLKVDPSNGETTLLHNEHDPVWTDIVPGLPARTQSGDLVWITEDPGTDTRRITVAGHPVTPGGLQVRAVLGVEGESILFTASEESTEIHLYSLDYHFDAPDVTRLTEGRGVFGGVRSGGVTVVSGARLDRPGSEVEVRTPSGTHPVASLAETPVITPRVELLRSGDREIRTAVLLPSGWEPGQGRLPVLVDPYGGPHAQRVLAVQRMYCEAQWLADQGFAVVIADGRGTPGRGPAWDRAVRGDFVGPVIEDQITALIEAARVHPAAFDLDRVAIRGWSFGGWLAGLAVLHRPDVFHAGIAGAPVTDWRLYDTHYTERYLGHPDEEPDNYTANSLIERAADLKRPLMLIHGLADDNVVAAHTLRLSSALLAAGRPHTVLPLSGVTHMTPQEVVAENLLHIQVDFLKSSLSG